MILPETEGRSLEDIEIHFSNDILRLNDIEIHKHTSYDNS